MSFPLLTQADPIPPGLTSSTRMSNAELFYRYARPGIVGLHGAEAALRVTPSIIRAFGGHLQGNHAPPSPWSHAFLVTERRCEGERVVIRIAESTVISATQREEGAQARPRWNGPQWSRLVIRRHNGTLVGQPDRKDIRKYTFEDHTPNVALLDLGLSGSVLQQVLERAEWIMADDSIDYGAMELVGTLWATLKGHLQDPNAFDTEDLFCTAFVRACLDPFCDRLTSIPAHISNTHPQHIFDAATQAGCPIIQRVRSDSIPALHAALASALWLLASDEVKQGGALITAEQGPHWLSF